MQSPVDDSTTSKGSDRLLGPALGDQKQGSFSINLWKNAFQDAFRRLCPVRAGGHECGCLPVLGRKVHSASCYSSFSSFYPRPCIVYFSVSFFWGWGGGGDYHKIIVV